MNGIRRERYFCNKSSASAVYERNRLVTITKATNVATYATYGDVAEGCTTEVRAKETDNGVSVYPIGAMAQSFLLKAAAAITRGNFVFPVAEGKVVQSSYNCATGVAAEPSLSANATYLLPAAVTGDHWTGHANAVAIYTHSDTPSWAFVDVSSTVNLGLTVYVTDTKKYYTWNGTSWVLAKAAAIANENANAGAEFECYEVDGVTRITSDRLPADMNAGIALVKQYTGNPGGTSVTILDSRVAAGDKAICQVQGGTTAAYVVSAVCTAGTITLTLSTNSGANTIITVIVVRGL